MKTSTFLSQFSVAVCLTALLSLSHYSELSARPKKVWVKSYKTAAGVVVPGYHRPASRAGFVWVAGKKGPNRSWIAGYWKPIKSVKGKVWVQGHVNTKGVWVDGFWRPKQKNGKIWIAGHRNAKGIWVKGHWKRV